MRKIISVFLPVIALVLLTSCKNGNPVVPDPPGPPAPEYGMVTFIETTDVPCDPRSQFSSNRFVLDSMGWPSGYFTYVHMEPQGDGTWVATVKVPASTATNPVWMVYIVDRCILSEGVWGRMSGTGLSVEPEDHSELRVRLRDGLEMTGFKYIPPDKITPQ